MTTQRRMPSGQGPARRPAAGSRVRHTGSTRLPRTTGTLTRTPAGRAARPASARRTVNVGPGTTKRTVATPPRAMTGRATVLIVVFVALALAYTYPLRVYLAQESLIAEMAAHQANQRQQIAATQEELAKWKDPAYIETQARERLFYVRPGTTPMLVFSDPAAAARDAGKPIGAPPGGRWYDTLWRSVRAAGTQAPN